MATPTKITLDEYATTLIRVKARQLIGKYGFTRSDREDLEQELTLDLLIRLGRFDQSKGRPATFVRMVVDRCIATLIRKRTCAARDYRRTRHSLEELGDEIGNGNLMEPAVDERPQRDLQIDLAEALDGLSDDLRSIAERLWDGKLPRRRGRSRGELRGTVMQLRRHLAHCGLDVYFSPTNPAARRVCNQ